MLFSKNNSSLHRGKATRERKLSLSRRFPGEILKGNWTLRTQEQDREFFF
jgi:hypothetical protein